ncbi:DUF6339 family protein [Allohahella marinimesophila]|uniref:Uncharacterized protein n=1 Tax=Allohahella marinimesophila TaxID=1054972 RepID=A0ABP7Q3V9_9GAMM
MTTVGTDLWWMSSSKVRELNESIFHNLDRYRNGDFSDLATDEGWSQKSILRYDPSSLASLTGKSSGELADSVLLFETLASLEPRLATSMNVWVPLLHTQLLDFARKRWFKTDGTDEDLVQSIKDHVFKGGLTGYRDDNAAARLWWTGYIGSRIARSKNSADIGKVLTPFMHSTDTRSNVFERPGIFMERGLAKHISDYLTAGKLPNHTQERVFRDFLININLKSNGRHFGDMKDTDVFAFLDGCR